MRSELAAALQRLVSCYDSNFAAIAFRFAEEEKSLEAVQQSTGKTRPKMATQGKGHRLSVDLPANFSAMRQGEEKDKSWFEFGPRKLCPAISARLHLKGGWRLHHLVEGGWCWYECRFAFCNIFFFVRFHSPHFHTMLHTNSSSNFNVTDLNFIILKLL